jgi:hypothetical protein
MRFVDGPGTLISGPREAPQEEFAPVTAREPHPQRAFCHPESTPPPGDLHLGAALLGDDDDEVEHPVPGAQWHVVPP